MLNVSDIGLLWLRYVERLDQCKTNVPVQICIFLYPLILMKTLKPQACHLPHYLLSFSLQVCPHTINDRLFKNTAHIRKRCCTSFFALFAVEKKSCATGAVCSFVGWLRAALCGNLGMCSCWDLGTALCIKWFNCTKSKSSIPFKMQKNTLVYRSAYTIYRKLGFFLMSGSVKLL